jgi:hypothetical protein
MPEQFQYYLSTVYFNGKRGVRARSPNEGKYYSVESYPPSADIQKGDRR